MREEKRRCNLLWWPLSYRYVVTLIGQGRDVELLEETLKQTWTRGTGDRQWRVGCWILGWGSCVSLAVVKKGQTSKYPLQV